MASDMAQKDRSAKASAPPRGTLATLAPAAGYLALAAFLSSVTQATLWPVYGATAAAEYHQISTLMAVPFGFMLRTALRFPGAGKVARYLAVWAFWIPLIESMMFHLGGDLGPIWGPPITSLICCHTVVAASSYAAAEAFEALDLESRFGALVAGTMPALAALTHFLAFEQWFRTLLPGLFVLSPSFSPIKLQTAIAVCYALLSPSKLLILALPALLNTLLMNPHMDLAIPSSALNDTLALESYTCLARRWSNTGYLSVLEDTSADIRLLRCDHSLLGGEFQLTPARTASENWTTNEPIYAVFSMLEAVRLVTTPTPHPTPETALVIGLGIGTAPTALITHGITTTIIELDPYVHALATSHFALPPNHTAHLTNALPLITSLSDPTNPSHERGKYTYIMHDVFTGGAEPLSLFTHEFLTSLRALLAPQGVAALNYAGDLSAPLTRRVLRTIRGVFGEQCRLFRDTPLTSAEKASRAANREAGREDEADFVNLVIFCRNAAGGEDGGVAFREAVEADFLGSLARRQYLVPRGEGEEAWPVEVEGEGTLGTADVGEFGREQFESANRHWGIMRAVLPHGVWEVY